jgi:hypothetical protein
MFTRSGYSRGGDLGGTAGDGQLQSSRWGTEALISPQYFIKIIIINCYGILLCFPFYGLYCAAKLNVCRLQVATD